MDTISYGEENMSPFSYEVELIKPVKQYFIKKGFTVFHEIRIGFCRADIVAINDDTVIAVELKLSDWKKALIQVRNYQLAAGYVYIAVPLKKVDLILKRAAEQLQKEGIGLLSVDERDNSIVFHVDAKRSVKMFGCLKIEELKRRKKKREMKRVLRFF